MPSRASSEANSRAERAVRSSVSRSKISSTLAVTSRFDSASALRGRPAQPVEHRHQGRVDVLGGRA